MKVQRCRAFLSAVAIATFTLGATPASPFTAVQKFVDGFNRGDAQTMLATCANGAVIIDDFPPHVWKSCANWYDSFVAFSRQDGDTNAVVTLGVPTHVDVVGDAAYVVVPTTYVFKHHGKRVTQNGSTWTLVLKHTAAGWRLTAWAWADGK